jgi:drug/metabolite transporter (DMT)-like permease
MILLTVGMISAGQLLFKYAARDLDFARPSSFFSTSLITALIIYGLATCLWLWVLSRVPLNIAFPFYGLTFLLVPLLGWLFLGERIGSSTITGSFLILIGVTIVAMGSRA